jgi:hypothetical protein
MALFCSVEISGLRSILVGKAADLGRRRTGGGMRINRHIETGRCDIRTEVLAILNSGGLLEFYLGRLRSFACCSLGHCASR